MHGVKAADIDGRGNGWIAQEDMKNDDLDGKPAEPLLIIPKDIIISLALVIQYAPYNTHFHQLLHAVQFQVSCSISERCFFETDFGADGAATGAPLHADAVGDLFARLQKRG